jgi:hypothetical protein
MPTPRLLFAPLLGLLLAAPAAAAEKGTWWEMTTEMEMVGMPFAMPATTFKVCQPDGDWSRPPEGKQDQNCTVRDVKRTGNSMKWKVTCTGEEPMEGEGEMTRTADTLSGRTRITSRQGEMNMKMKGKRVGGACDPEALRKETEAKVEQYKAQGQQLQAQADANQARQCDDAIREMQVAAIAGSYTLCKDPAKKAAFCARARTEEGFGKLMVQAEMEKASAGAVPGPKAAAKACQLDLAAVQQELCAGAAKRESLGFLGAWCPAEAKVIARRECAGRGYTAMQGSKYRDFCGRFAGEQLDAEAKPAPEKKKEKKEDDATEQGKKLLKGVFGF